MPCASWVADRLVGFDLETTGLDREVEEPISFAFAAFEDGGPVSLEEGYIEPTRPISDGAAGIHGLTQDRLFALGAVEHEDGVRAIERQLLELSDEGTPIVGANLPYDLTMVDRTLGRLERPTSLVAGGWHGPAFDVLVIDRALDRDFEARPVRKLSALCEHYGISVDLHTAGGDATAAVGILLAQAERFPAFAALTAVQLYAQQAVWHRAWCEEFSARRMTSGRRPLDHDERAWPYLERADRSTPTLF